MASMSPVMTKVSSLPVVIVVSSVLGKQFENSQASSGSRICDRVRSMVLSTAGLIVLVVILPLAGWWLTHRPPKDDRIPLVFWGHPTLGDEVYTLIHQFELKNPRYKVVMGSAVALDVTGDAQRLLSAIAGGVP